MLEINKIHQGDCFEMSLFSLFYVSIALCLLMKDIPNKSLEELKKRCGNENKKSIK